MNTLSFKKASLALVVGALLTLPGCCRKKNNRKIVIETEQPDYMIDEGQQDTLVYNSDTEQLEAPAAESNSYLTANNNEEFNDLDTSGFLSFNQITQQDKNAVVYFPYGKAQLSSSEKENLSVALDTANALLQEGKKVVVKGHSCELGKKANSYNTPLSNQRAQAVANYLVHNGIPAESIVVLGVGAEEPAAFDRSSDAQAHNRRVEVSGINA